MARKFAMVFGWVFVVLGVLGFFSNPIVGGGPGSIFLADTAHNLVHLVFGAVILWAAYGAADKSAMVLKVIGVIYLLLALVGFFAPGVLSGLVAVNGADNWLHLVLAALMLWGGMAKPSASTMSSGGSSGMPMGTM